MKPSCTFEHFLVDWLNGANVKAIESQGLAFTGKSKRYDVVMNF